MASLVMPFSSLARMHTKYLATKCIIIQHCWIRSTVRSWTEKGFVDSTFEQMPGQWFFSQYCIHLLRRPVKTDLLLWDGWQTSAQACTCY